MSRTKQRSTALVGELMPPTHNTQQLADSEARRRAALSNAAFVAHVGAGRKPGAKNKTTKRIRESLSYVYDKLGGDVAFLRWARANPDQFYKFWMRAMPQEDKTRPPQLAVFMLRGDDKV